MTSNTTSNPNFYRPLLDYAQVLRKHQYIAMNLGDTQTLLTCIDTVKKLEGLQGAHEILPGQKPNSWFLSAGFASAHKNLRSRCACLKNEIEAIRGSYTKDDDAMNSHSIDRTLQELSYLLEEAALDLSCLSRCVIITEPTEPSTPARNFLEDISLSLEA